VTLAPSPPARILCTVALVAGILLIPDLRILAAMFAVATCICVAMPQVRGAHLKFLLFVWLPLAAWLVVVWGFIVAAPPGAPVHSNSVAGLLYAARISMRLAAMVGVMQALLLSVSLDQLGRGLFSLRLPRPVVLVILSVFALGPELRKRMDQVLTARAARGLMRGGGRWRAVRNTASTLVPLVSWGFRSAALRSEYWLQRRLLESPVLSNAAGFAPRDGVYLVLSSAWCMLAIMAFVKARLP
jgi:energy-coupling factor transporter transmembrane protein EcfT